MPYTPPDYVPAPLPVTGSPSLQAARERAIGLLTDRYADDSLSEVEFEARLAWLSAADTPSRIEELVADLATPRTVVHAPSPVGYDLLTPAEGRIAAFMSSTKRTGQWTMPERLVIRAVMSELRLDLRFANLPPVAEIDVTAVMANVRIIVPPEVVVESDVMAVMANVRNDASDTPYSAAPRIQLHGSAVMAEVRVQVRTRRR